MDENQKVTQSPENNELQSEAKRSDNDVQRIQEFLNKPVADEVKAEEVSDVSEEISQEEFIQELPQTEERTDEIEPAIDSREESNKSKWYVIHTYSGYENKVKSNLMKRIETMAMKEKISNVLVPTEEEIEFRNGKRKTVQKKIYPGYVYVEMIMTNESWNVVRNTPGVTGFVGPQGPGFKPIPLDKEEERHIKRLIGQEAPQRIKISVEKGQGVRIKSGPFRDLTGIVDEVYPDKEKVKILIYIFGRETPVEIDFGQIEKL
jgi:transcriptional antiterminator NusG